jgi:hypothetical protein
MEETLRIGLEAIPLHEEIKGGQSKGQPHLEWGPRPITGHNLTGTVDKAG